MRLNERFQASAKQVASLLVLGAFLGLLMTGCATPPMGPLPGLGPPFDQLFGMLLAVGLIVLGVYFGQRFLRRRSPKEEDRNKRSPAEEIVQERYARGEISRDEFLLILTDLKTPRHEKP